MAIGGICGQIRHLFTGDTVSDYFINCLNYGKINDSDGSSTLYGHHMAIIE